MEFNLGSRFCLITRIVHVSAVDPRRALSSEWVPSPDDGHGKAPSAHNWRGPTGSRQKIVRGGRRPCFGWFPGEFDALFLHASSVLGEKPLPHHHRMGLYFLAESNLWTPDQIRVLG